LLLDHVRRSEHRDVQQSTSRHSPLNGISYTYNPAVIRKFQIVLEWGARSELLTIGADELRAVIERATGRKWPEQGIQLLPK
jgi:hypothetical protein